jgi:hypothetical protein
MKVRLTMRRTLRGRYLVLSAIGHVAAFGALTQIQFGSASSRRPIFDQFVKPKDHSIVYYRPPKVKKAEAAPQQQTGPKREAKAWQVSPRTVIATAPKPKSQQQILFQPQALKELQVDVPVPSVIAKVETTALPLPPKPAAKQFRPPPPSKQEPKLVTRTLVSNDPVANVEIGGTPLPTVPSPSLGALPSKPREDLPQAPEPTPGNAKADVVIASVSPAATDSVPLANRPGAFARAPNPGETSPGSNPGALTIPNVTVREPAPRPAEPPKVTIQYSEKVRSGAISTLSAPLRPSGRSVPRALESRFTGRTVYTMVVPIENMPAYDGDWVLWFAEIAPPAGQTPLLKAPSPNRKQEAQIKRTSAVVRAQIAAVIGKDGKLRNVTIINNPTASTPPLASTAQALVLEDFEGWEFTPAMRNGTPIEVDAVFDIPFHLPQ